MLKTTTGEFAIHSATRRKNSSHMVTTKSETGTQLGIDSRSLINPIFILLYTKKRLTLYKNLQLV